MNNEEDRVPIHEVLPNIRIHPVDGATPIDAFVLIKSLDEDGDVTWSFRTSSSLNLEELLGALTIQVRLLERSLIEQWDE